MSNLLTVKDEANALVFSADRFELIFSKSAGKFTDAAILEGKCRRSMISANGYLGDNIELDAMECPAVRMVAPDAAELKVVRENADLRIIDTYEIYASGWVICTFCWEVTGERFKFEDAAVGITLDEKTVFSHAYRWKFINNDQDERESIRGMALDFSIDERPITNSINFLLEKVTSDLDGRACRKVVEEFESHRFAGWKLTSGWRYPRPGGFEYRNRWGFTVSGLSREPNPVRGQRIYHYYGSVPSYPDDGMLNEMAEYGASILVLHNAWKYIGTGMTLDEQEMARVTGRCRELGIKLLPYCTPYMIAHRDPSFPQLEKYRTDCLNVWISSKNDQMHSYTPFFENWDCDELCLRCPEAFDFASDAIIKCVRKYDLDGLYVDFAWPTQGLCNHPAHHHEPGLFNFYDYFRLMRYWRQALGETKIMIGHGGGFIIASDMLEGFDACLTGEAQLKLSPETIGQQFGKAPTLWTIQRTKGAVFRSAQTIEESIHEGVTIHYGVGIGGQAVIASLDPAHHRELIALWQIYRAFPVEHARFYNYLFPGVIELDNPEILYSLYVTPAGQALLILVNGGGERTAAYPCVGVNIALAFEKLGLEKKLHCVPLRGNDYLTFRIGETMCVENGLLRVAEIAHHEFMGFVLFPDGGKPRELTALEQHLQGRPERYGEIIRAKQERLQFQDRKLHEFSLQPLAQARVAYHEFTRGRSAE